jgi:hypothetical protein
VVKKSGRTSQGIARKLALSRLPSELTHELPVLLPAQRIHLQA